jgi:hypothetical protein
MAEMRVNSAVVCEANIPIGIVTDTDMSSKIATGRFPTVSVDKIMSTQCNCPGKCFAGRSTITDVKKQCHPFMCNRRWDNKSNVKELFQNMI